MSKPNKGKEKKLKRQQELQKAQQLKVLIKAANEVTDGLEAFAAFRRYERRGLAAQLSYHTANTLPPGTLDWAVQLCEANMRGIYERGFWKWSDRDKRAQMAHPDTRFLLATDACAATEPQQDGAAPAAPDVPGALAGGVEAAAAAAAASGPLAYASFRFEEEGGAAVLYLYEVQLVGGAQRKGLGRFMMQLVELLARRQGMQRVMLTVMHENVAALELYRKLGYGLDESSPGYCDPESDCTYDILCKPLARPAAAAALQVRPANTAAT